MLFAGIKTERDLDALKKRILKDRELFATILRIRKAMNFRYGAIGDKQTMITNAELLAFYRELVKSGKEKSDRAVELLLRKIKTKSNSGVAVVSVLTKPYPCPGNCLYCPTEAKMPKSYLSKEPAAARALLNDFDAVRQTHSRLKALVTNGHLTDKVEMIVIGGTWGAYPQKYREDFARDLYFACNTFGARNNKLRKKRSLVAEQKINETAKCRVIGLSVETRPDWIKEKEILHMRALGVTKVELGVQHLDEKVLWKNRRFTSRTQIAEATRLLRDCGFKIVYHMMLNLPFSTPRKDLASFEELFVNKDFCPDMLKIYPCVVLESSDLCQVWRDGKFKPYSARTLKELLIAVKKIVPPYVRIMRVIRDIPGAYVLAGNKATNLRQDILADQKKNNWSCKCIRCREVREEEVQSKELKMKKTIYPTLGGKEIFLSWEMRDGKKIASFLRLRLPREDVVATEALRGAAIVRELHTYGLLTQIGEKGRQSQHLGLGRKLLQEAEHIARQASFNKIAVISGVGVRDYYRKRGYKLHDTYMVKLL
jgi:elongator complex protein 3